MLSKAEVCSTCVETVNSSQVERAGVEDELDIMHLISIDMRFHASLIWLWI